jgi:hypothetical protein
LVHTLTCLLLYQVAMSLTDRIVVDSFFAASFVNKHWSFGKERLIVVQVAGGASLSDEQVTCFVTGVIPVYTAMLEPFAVVGHTLALCVTLLGGFV